MNVLKQQVELALKNWAKDKRFIKKKSRELAADGNANRRTSISVQAEPSRGTPAHEDFGE